MECRHRERYEYLKKKKIREKRREEKNKNQTSGQRILREILGWIVYLLIIAGTTYFIINYVGQRTMVSGDSMESTLHDGDNLIVDKISYRFRNPKRYEVIVFPYKYAEDTYYIKRIIGLPGETVQIINGFVFINGLKLDENYGLEVIEDTKYGIAASPIKLGEDEYFVLGDNRNHSADSRETSVGVLKREDLLGRAWVRIWPLDDIGVILHE